MAHAPPQIFVAWHARIEALAGLQIKSTLGGKMKEALTMRQSQLSSYKSRECSVFALSCPTAFSVPVWHLCIWHATVFFGNVVLFREHLSLRKAKLQKLLSTK